MYFFSEGMLSHKAASHLTVWPPPSPHCMATSITSLYGHLHHLTVWPPPLPHCMATSITLLYGHLTMYTYSPLVHDHFSASAVYVIPCNFVKLLYHFHHPPPPHTYVEDVFNMLTRAGLAKEQLYVDRRLQVNRGRQLRMYRVWIQAKFRKPLACV